jgi:hypothetical protein
VHLHLAIEANKVNKSKIIYVLSSYLKNDYPNSACFLARTLQA